MPHTRTADPREVVRPLPSGRRSTSAGMPGEDPRLGSARVAARGSPAAGPSPAVREMMLRLPAHLLRHTAARFAHVLEPIARDWASPERLHATLDALVFDDRGGREGFPPEVLTELAELRACHERWVGPRSPLGR